MSERIAQAFWFAVLLVFFLAADQALKAQQDTHSDEAQQDKYSEKEKKICIDNKASSVPYGEGYSVPYEDIDGQAVVEGDIVIGATADLLKRSPSYAPIVPDYIKGKPKRWGNGVEPYAVPYVIDGSVSATDLILSAMRKWQERTGIRFHELVGPRDWKRQNYVKFVSKNSKKLCTSNTGVKEKPVNKSDEGYNIEDYNINVVDVVCNSWGKIAHEIGHVLGLGHEHSRSDRGSYITVLWGNIEPGNEVWYCPAISDPNA